MAQVVRFMTRSAPSTFGHATPIWRHGTRRIAPRQNFASFSQISGSFQNGLKYRSAGLEPASASVSMTWSQRVLSKPSVRASLRVPASTQRRAFTAHSTHRSAAKKDSGSKQQSTAEPLQHAVKADTTSPPKAVPQILKRLTPPVLHENIYTLPNFLTTTRIITAPVISYALLNSQPVLAFGLFAYSSVTDLVDGYLARRYKSGTVLGSILDPFADKLLMTLTTISLYSIGTFPWWLALIILGRDGGLLLSALYFRWISLPPPRTMKRYWDFSLPSAEVRPTEISKINTLLQFLLVADAVLLPVLPVNLVESFNLWGVFEGWMGLVAGTTIWSGLSYVFSKDAIRFIGQDGEKKGKST